MGINNVALYAMWKALPTYTVTYNGNGNTSGSAPIDNNHYLTGNPVTVLGNINNLAKTGYTFIGWNTSPLGTGTNYLPGNTFPMGINNVALYAMWKALPTYTVTYNGNGNTSGSVPIDNNYYFEGGTVTVLDNPYSLAKNGFSFAGWSISPLGNGKIYHEGNTFIIGNSDVVFYSIWCRIIRGIKIF